jgi:sirohydrochlorin cobaltochelatase
METVIVLAMHGVPPKDFPRRELSEFFSLHTQLRRSREIDPQLSQRYDLLETRMRNWPRTPDNDPFFFASQELAQCLAEESGNEVITGYNEFCAPSLESALEDAVRRVPQRVIIITPMMTRGGEHAESEIPALVAQFQSNHPEIDFIYAWPFNTRDIASFLTTHLKRFLSHS